jgi:hypothetical protein
MAQHFGIEQTTLFSVVITVVSASVVVLNFLTTGEAAICPDIREIPSI